MHAICAYIPFVFMMILVMQTFQESLLAAGAGITLVDSVVMPQPSTLVT